MADDLILQKLSHRFKLLGPLPLAGKLGLKRTALDRLLAPLMREDMVQRDEESGYRSVRSVLLDLGEFVHPARAGDSPEYPRPDCCWPHSA
ncbi:MAG: hypothetical protein KF760_15490 [Candidatus Eremiobacteraeota bacterium]|nr:hypothetical protein [Candidatus Eremiobacteraeota bacterium]MCW5869319.1 hypothetical protein [Candidatus Eremiobacteraeota bacterium]